MIDVRVDPVEITVGDENELSIALTNNSSKPCTNIVFKLRLPPEIVLLRGPDRIALSKLDPGDSKSTKVTVQPKLAGDWAATNSSLSFLDHRGRRAKDNDVTLAFKARIEEPPPAPKIELRVSTRPLLVKRWQKMEGELENIGQVALRRVLVRASGCIESDGACPIADLPPGETRPFEISVYPLQSGTTVPIKVEAEFPDGPNSVKRIPRTFDVEVHESRRVSKRTADASPVTYNLRNVRILLNEAFSDTELRRMCREIDALRPVYHSLSKNTGKDEIVDRIIEHTMHKGGIDSLLDIVKQDNHLEWESHLPYSLQGKRTILFLAADPLDIERIRLQKEFREIKQTLEQSRLRDSFELKSALAVRSEDLTRDLVRAKPSIVHFSGHGSRSGAICIEDQFGRTRPVEPEALSFLLQLDLLGKSLECVVLNACYSEIQARVIAQHVKYVVGMRDPIKDNSAIDFSVGFYQSLGEGSSIVDAFETGLALVSLNKLDFRQDHLIPRLYVDGLLAVHGQTRES